VAEEDTMPLVVTIGTADRHPMRKTRRAGRGSVPHAGYESAEKPTSRKANDADDTENLGDEVEDRGRVTRMADARTPSPPERRRRTRVTKVSRGTTRRAR
jgi:hypothetical protein